jgi:hypothetical protein
METVISGFADCVTTDGFSDTVRWSNLNGPYTFEQTTDICGDTPAPDEIALTILLGTADDYGDPGILLKEHIISHTHEETYVTQLWIVVRCQNDPTHVVFIDRFVYFWQKWRWVAGSSTPPVVVDEGCTTYSEHGYTPLGVTPEPCKTGHMATVFTYDKCGTIKTFLVQTDEMIGAP